MVTRTGISIVCLLASVLGVGLRAAAAPPTCTTHFFDWYVVDAKTPLAERQKRWTYRVDWAALGIKAEEIGNSVHYYEVQFQKIRAAGFDGLHYEWHANNPKPQFLEALKKTALPVAMFYDMEIRFHGRGPGFIKPTAEFARTVVADVLSFYRSVPESLWLCDRNGKLPIIVYGYAFDRTATDPRAWDQFYRAVIEGVENGLGRRVVFHWTNNGSPQQMYGFQHFPEIQSYIFNEASTQTPVNAQSITFVVHYDDLGVSFARGGNRPTRWIRNDIRYLQEGLWLALHTNPDLLFNYGWNELYEGEHLLPDALWGTWRYDLAAAMVKDVKAHAKADLPRALVIVDDFLRALYRAKPDQAAVLRAEMRLLGQLRAVVPRAEVVLPGQRRKLDDYDVIFSLATDKNPEEEASLAACARKVVYANPDPRADTPVTRRFTAGPRQPVAASIAGLANENVLARRKVDVDLRQFPFLEYRARNSPASMFHIRYYGLNGQGKEVPAWSESGPTDDRHTDGRWVTNRINLAQAAREAAGEPIERLTRIDVILDDMDDNGTFTLDLDYLRLSDQAGTIGWAEEFPGVCTWTVAASFGHLAGARERFGLAAVQEEEECLARMTLRAAVSQKDSGVDESTQRLVPLPGVRVLCSAEFLGSKVPVLLGRDQTWWLNTCSPNDACWGKLMGELAGSKPHRGVAFRGFGYRVRAEGLATDRHEAPMLIQEQPLPIDRVRLVAPPELDQALSHTLPAGWQQMSLRIIQGRRRTIPLPDPNSDTPSITLRPGEVVELVRER